MKGLLIFFLSLCFIFIPTQTHPGGVVLQLSKDEMRKTKGNYCGSNLANTLSVLCRGNYNTRIPIKKSCEREFY